MEKETQATGQNEMDISASLDDFVATGRTGRRNAMPNILDSSKAGVGTGDLAFNMEKLNCSDGSKASDAAAQSQASSSAKGS